MKILNIVDILLSCILRSKFFLILKKITNPSLTYITSFVTQGCNLLTIGKCFIYPWIPGIAILYSISLT